MPLHVKAKAAFIVSLLVLSPLSISLNASGNESNVVKWMGSKLFYVYREYISPVDDSRCGFAPTCSQYSKTSFENYGFCKGFVMTFDRIQRCHYCAFHGGYKIERNTLVDPPSDNEF